MNEDPLASLKAAVGRGEALLLLGQDYSPEVVDQVLVDAKELFGGGKAWTSLPEIYTSIGSDENTRGAVATLFENQQPPLALLELASMPWMAVVTSAVDPLISRALLSVGSQRRIVELGPTQLSSVSASRGRHMLYLIRAFGVSEMAGGSSSIPTSTPALAEARLIRLPTVIAAIPRLVGLHGYVALEGISQRDWLDEQGLTALCVTLSSLPPGRVFWFGPASDQVRASLRGTARFEERSLQSRLHEWEKDESTRNSLRQSRELVFGIGERVVTLEQNGRATQIRLTAPEWRSISRIGSLLEDSTVLELQAQERALKTDLVAYLRRSRAGVPDWSGPARGLIFERAQVRNLIEAVRAFIGERKASILDQGEESRGARRVPYLLSGPPASGKTMGLLQAAWTLRARCRLCAIWLLPGVSGLDTIAIEHVCRLLESKGARWIVLFLDAAEPEEYFRLKRRLEADGRKVLVVGAESHLHGPRDDEPLGEFRRFSIAQLMSPQEMTDLGSYLARHEIQLPPSAVGSPDFLRSLSAAVPEAQLGALPSLVDEYEQVLESGRASDKQGAATFEPVKGSLTDQLRRLFPDLIMKDDESDGAMSRFSSDPLLKDLLNIILFCAQLDRPVSVDLVLKVLGAETIGKYPTFAQIFARTALVQEVELDQDGALALTTSHQLHALWLLRVLFPDRSLQLDILRRIAMSIDWDPDAYPGDSPHQDFVLDLFRTTGPRGQYKDLYASRQSLGRLRQLIGDVRERLGIEQPKLLTLEAIILGDLVAVRESTETPESALERCRLALALLRRAEDLIRRRRPSDARNFELQRALTLASDIRGSLINTLLRAKGLTAAAQEVYSELARIEEDAIRAQSYSPSFHALDIVCWSHKDAFDLLPQSVEPKIRAHLLETIESILEVALEEGIDRAQQPRYRLRQQELQSRLGNWQLSEELASKLRDQGDFTGELSLSRDRLRQAERNGADVSAAGLRELLRLCAFRPHIFRQDHAVRFLHTLWSRAFVKGRLGEGAAKLVRASPQEWRMLEEITRVRLQFTLDSDLPYALFFLGWALYQLQEVREARGVLSHLERQSFGNPRRVGELAYLTDSEGRRRVFRGKVVHSRTGQVRLSIAELDGEVMDLRPEVEMRIAPAGLVLGEFVEVSIALNYRGAQARPPLEGEVRDIRGR
jgi:hypothetical protein